MMAKLQNDKRKLGTLVVYPKIDDPILENIHSTFSGLVTIISAEDCADTS